MTDKEKIDKLLWLIANLSEVVRLTTDALPGGYGKQAMADFDLEYRKALKAIMGPWAPPDPRKGI